jgi:hypothetical protein
MSPLAPFAPAAPQLSRFHLSAEQVEQFDRDGFLILRQWIGPEMLRKLQASADRWIEDGLAFERQHGAGPLPASDYGFAQRPHGRVLFRVNYLHAKDEASSLELLGSPEVLGVVESLAGPNFLPTYESMVFKMPGDGEVIPWHQDAVFPRRFRVFNFDLYLDASRRDAGALHVIPGTQRETQDICSLAERHGWHPPGSVQVEMEPGDVLIHDDMVVHGSPRTAGAPLRRTIYFEFRPAEQILAEGPWDRTWIEKRMRLIPVALRRHQAAFPQAEQFAWRVSPEFKPAPVTDEASALRTVHEVHTSGTFCSAGGAAQAKPGK